MRNYILSALLTGLSLNAQAAIPNLIANYAVDPAGVTFKEIATATNKVLTPRDLDFDSAGNLWIVNKGTEASGSSTVKIYNPGLATARYRYQIDVNASHFMCLATAIAFGDNGNFATSPGVLDANHTETNGGFTGPTLWNGDSTIYVKPNNGNGSHIDMLHESPYSMGIAHEKGNAYWVFDAFSHDIVRYDFVKPHVPGGDDHSDGLIRRFPEVAVKWISQDIPCHVVVDKAKGWLYIVDGGNKRILRLDIASGTPNGAPAKPQEEETKEYVKMAGAKWEVVTDKNLIQPTGIDVLDNNLVVSDHSTGEIILYDISALPAKETARIATGGKGVMGLVIGPNGRIWFVNAITNKVMMAEPKPNLVALRPRGREAKARVNIRLLPGQGPVAIDGRVRVLGNLLRSY